jgi:hypothetical protein
MREVRLPASFSQSFRVAAFAAMAVLAAVAGRGAVAAEPGRVLLSKINVQPPPSAVCHTVDEVNLGLFPRQQVIGYDFAGDEAGKLSQAIHGNVKAAPADAALIRLVLIFSADEALAFQFGSDGCHLMTVDLDVREMALVFERAEVAAPFGSTWSRLLDRVLWSGPAQ